MGRFANFLWGTKPQPAEAPTFSVDVPPEFFGLASYSSAPSVAKVKRCDALSVPAVKRSRDAICGALSTLPLREKDGNGNVVDNPLLVQPEFGIPRSVTMARTAADVLFDAVAWWRIVEFSGAFPSRVERIDTGRVKVTKGKLYLDGKVVPNADSEFIRFDSSSDPLLVVGARAIRALIQLDAAALRNSDGVPPMDFFTPVDPSVQVDADEVTEFLGKWKTAREQGGTAFIPGQLKYGGAEWDPSKLQLSEARQHAVLEIARLTGLDPEDLGVSTTSRTYANTADRRRWFIDTALAPISTPMVERLSMPDVVREGHAVSLDYSAFLSVDDLRAANSQETP